MPLRAQISAPVFPVSFAFGAYSLKAPLSASSQMLLVLDPFQNLHFSVRSGYYLSSLDWSGGYTFLFKSPREEEGQAMVFHAEPGSYSPG